MASAPAQRQIDRLLHAAEAALAVGNRLAACMPAQSVLALDQSNSDACAYVVVAGEAGAAIQGEAAPHSQRKLLGLIENSPAVRALGCSGLGA